MPASLRAADFSGAEFSSGVPAAYQSSQPPFSSGQTAQKGPAFPPAGSFAEREVSPRRTRGSETAQPYSPQVPAQQDQQHESERQSERRQEPSQDRTDDYLGTPESQMSEQTPMQDAFAPTSRAKQVEVSSGQSHEKPDDKLLAELSTVNQPEEQEYDAPAVGPENFSRDAPEVMEFEDDSYTEPATAEPVRPAAARKDESKLPTDHLSVSTPASREDEKIEVPAQQSRAWLPKEDEKVEVPEATHRSNGLPEEPEQQPRVQPAAEETQRRTLDTVLSERGAHHFQTVEILHAVENWLCGADSPKQSRTKSP